MTATITVNGRTVEPLPSIYQRNFPPDTLRRRRRAVADRIGPDACAVIQGATQPAGSGLFRQTNEMFYLAGIEVPHAYLTIDGTTGQSVLYLPHRNPAMERSEGAMLHSDDPEQVVELTGVDRCEPLEALASNLARLALRPRPPALRTPLRPAEGAQVSRDMVLSATAAALSDPWDRAETREAAFASRLSQSFPNLAISDLSDVLDDLREVKDDIEIDMLRWAGKLTADAISAAMRATRPGVAEYHLNAIAQYVFLAGGARAEGYRGIIGGGTNAWHGHYGRQCDVLADGDLVLMDHAPDCGYYTSDIGRMWPVNGRFDDDQRRLYGFIVRSHREFLERLGPGVVPEDLLAEVKAVMTGVVESTAWSHPHHERAARGALEFAGHLSHPVGMAVHDVGDYRSRPLAEGVVFALDPMIWIPEELQYVRCEDTVVITSDGCEVLTGAAPLDCEEIEAEMQLPGPFDAWDPRDGV
jgi:Xaa-Pro aminopeptidase